MLQFFKVNDPFRLVGILLFLVLFRLPYHWLGAPVTQPEMVWLLIGERIAEGHVMYSDIMDDTGPFSTVVYGLLHLLFGRSLLAQHILASLIILFQVTYLNFLFIRFKTYVENTYLPSIIFLILFHLSYDFLVLSPSLMGNTFILLAFGQFFSQTAVNKNSTESILLLGLFGGAALCFHFPLIVFFPVMLGFGVMMGGFNFQQLILAVTSYFLPIALVSLYFFWIDGFMDFVEEFILASRMIDGPVHTSYGELLFIFGLPLTVSLFGFFSIALVKKLYVNQQKQNQLMILYFVCASCTIFLANRVIAYQFLGLIPVFTYYIVHFLASLKKEYAQSLLFYTLFLGIPFIGYSWLFYKKNDQTFYNYALQSGESYSFTEGAKVLVLGNDLGYYQHASLATPYLNYAMAKPFLTDLGTYQRKAEVYRHFSDDKPEWVVDEEGVFSELLLLFPQMQTLYTKESEYLYKLK